MAEPAVRPQPMTFEQAALLDPDRQPGELVDGEWVPVTRASARHGKVVARVVRILGRFLDDHPLGELLAADPGMKLGEDPDTLRGPDVAFIRAERIPPEGLPDEWWAGAPDLAIEVQSKSQSDYELQQKALEYLGAGAALVWVLDSSTEVLVAYSAPNLIRILRGDESVDGADVLPGFTCGVSEFFK